MQLRTSILDFFENPQGKTKYIIRCIVETGLSPINFSHLSLRLVANQSHHAMEQVNTEQVNEFIAGYLFGK